MPVMQQIKLQASLARPTYVADVELGALLAPERRDTFETLDYSYTLQTDHAGFTNRDPWPADTDVAVLGNSLITGSGVGFDGQFTTLLQQKLGGRSVLNLGVPGGGPEHQYQVYRRFAAAGHPKLVVATLWLSWDIDNALQLHHWLAEKSSMDFTEYRLTYPDTHPLAGSARPRMLTTLRNTVSKVLSRSYLLQAVYARVRPWAEKRALVESVDFAGGDVLYLATRDQKRLANGLERPGTPRIKEIFFRPLELLKSEVEAQGGRFVIVLVPCKEEIYAAESYPEVLRTMQQVKAGLDSRQLPTLDLYPVFRELGSARAPFYRADAHLNEYGNHIVADALEKWIAAERLFDRAEG